MVSLKIEAIVPGKMARGSDYAREIERALQRHQEGTRRDLKATTYTWDTVVVFHVRMERSGNDLVISAYTDNKIYKFVNDGTHAHIIRPKKAKVLAFVGGYRAKTVPGKIGSQSGGATGKQTFATYVLHPGTQARKFTEAIAKKRGKLLQSEIQTAITRASKRTRQRS